VCCDKKMFKTFLGVICFGIRFDIVNCHPFAFRFTFGLENKRLKCEILISYNCH
jgi:hypothetical protein